MKKKLSHYFPAVAAVALAATLAAVAPAQPPADKGPELKLPEVFQPRVVKNAVKAVATVDPNLKLVNVEAAWLKSKGEGVTVFVLDTGIDLSHPEFKGVSVEKVNFSTDPDASDGNGHGTFCASEIVGQTNVDGVAPKIKKVVALKVLANNGSGDMDWFRKAVEYVTAYDTQGGPKVVSASLGATPGRGTDIADTMPDLQAAMKKAISAGVVFVLAAGNDDGKYPPNSVGWPARYNGLPGLESLIVVAACDLNRRVTDFSSVGPATWTTVVGHDVLGALPKGQYGRWDGTSMATPIAAGVAACWLSAYGGSIAPKDRQAAVAEAFRAASSFPDKRHPARGYGLPDCAKMFAAPVVGQPPQPPKERPFAVTITLDDLAPAKRAELIAGGVDTFRLEVGHGHRPGGTVVPVKPDPVPVYQPAPVRGYWQPAVQHPWYPPVVYPTPQVMPAPACPGGACPPQQWYPGQRVVQWIR